MSVPALRFTEFIDKWTVKKLEEISEHISYGLTVRPEYINDGIPLISAREIKDGVIDYVNAPKISQESFDKLSNKAMANKGDIFLSKTGTIGLVAYVASDLTIAITQNIAVIRILDRAYYHPFILQSLTTTKFYKSAIDKVNQSTIMDLQLQDIRKLTLDLPLIPEQTKIANFLTAVDEKITQITQKHNLLNQYKNGVMQQIFSQELRFKDGDGGDFPEWEEFLLKNALIKNSAKNKNIEFTLVQSISNKHGFINQDELFENRVIASKDLSNYYIIRKGAFAYNPSRIDVGSLAYKNDDLISVISPLYVSFYTKSNLINDSFLFNWFDTEQFKNQMNSSFEGSVRNTLSYDALSKILIDLPSIKEQTKIANFLTTIDDKINATQTQLQAVKQYKQGLLQQMFV